MQRRGAGSSYMQVADKGLEPGSRAPSVVRNAYIASVLQAVFSKRGLFRGLEAAPWLSCESISSGRANGQI